ncbi:class I SAM-dependent methyltransferase [Rossellomorea vietnamensis]|uniref:class I SAM-dependent methyltransferase n=1 Tax=Rossellomorea vietnamensis TaxID=218284 RepID=UPI003CF867A1
MPVIKIKKMQNLQPEVLKHIKQTDSVIDIGCGIKPQQIIKPQVHVCIEPAAEYIEHLEKNIQNRDRIYILINSTWDILKIFPPNSVDTIIFTDVIEHLEKEDRRKLIGHARRVARVQVILFTPLGFLPQRHPDGKDAWGLEGGKWQNHKSGWEPGEFDSSWNIFVCEKFHSGRHNGELFDEPYGAFWAILNIERKAKSSQAFTLLVPEQ